MIQALIRLDNSVIREILTDGSDFERRLLGEQISHIRAVDSSFKGILLDRKEAINLRRIVITLIRQEGEKWPYEIERLLKDEILLDSMRQMTIDEEEDTVIKIEAERIMTIFRKQQE